MTSATVKYLTFELGGETYGIEIFKVNEIIRTTAVTRVPRTPKFLRGVTNLRGKIVPVVDMRLKFGLEPKEDTARTCTIVVELGSVNDQTLGLVVDEVSEVIDIGKDQIEPPPWFGADQGPGFVRGIGKVGDQVLILLDLDEVLSRNEVSLVGEIVSETSESKA